MKTYYRFHPKAKDLLWTANHNLQDIVAASNRDNDLNMEQLKLVINDLILIRDFSIPHVTEEK